MSREYPQAPLVGVAVAVLRPDAVLLIVRGRPPNQGAWTFPGGGQELGETVEATARRELFEETGLVVGPLLLAAHVDSIHRDEGGRVRFHYTILDFCAHDAGGDAVAADDAQALAWVPFDELDRHDLSDEMAQVIAASRRLLGL